VSRSLNKVTLIGNLGADPEIRTTPNGSKVAQFSLATEPPVDSASGEKQEKTEWHKCVAWNAGPQGHRPRRRDREVCEEGRQAVRRGRIEYRQYEDKDKQTRYVTEINVREILLLGGGKGGGEGFESSRPAKAAAGGKGGDAGFSDFPEAMDGDDDLPF
jgi:single-strand DNA-binding protein